MRLFSFLVMILVSLTISAPHAWAQGFFGDTEEDTGAAVAENTMPEEITLRNALVIPRLGRSGRSAIRTDALEHLIVKGEWTTPSSGDTLTGPGGRTETWTEAEADENGNLRHRGYALFIVDSPEAGVMMLNASGHSLVYVNGEPRGGDPYGTGWMSLPVKLEAGANEFLFVLSRGALNAKLVRPRAPFMLQSRDQMRPDAAAGEPLAAWASVIVTNATEQPLDDLTLSIAFDDQVAEDIAVPPLPPLSTRRVAYRLKRPKVESDVDKLTYSLSLWQNLFSGVSDVLEASIPVRKAGATRTMTFVSRIDGSVQYFAWKPAQPRPEGTDSPDPALVLSLHGAGVQAMGQANSYANKPWAHIVAPTNRRPFGFDWEDWGRLDAIEVLDFAQAMIDADPSRTYLTGHSMGGHGTWHVGATFPDRFAAIGPSAGWISFWSYAGADRFESGSPIEQILTRATTASDTLQLTANLKRLGVYILHGSADDNVPAAQAHQMVEHLSEFHHDFRYHEQPGAGHWWGSSDEPGAECLDWPAMFDFFAARRLPSHEETRVVEFVTANPGVSSRCGWATIESQIEPMKVSTINLQYDPWKRRYRGTTGNVERLAISVQHMFTGAPITLILDEQQLDPVEWSEDTDAIRVMRDADGTWALKTDQINLDLKGPHRSGPFKDAFRHQAVLVYGTQGSDEENAWAYMKARYDAETYSYRGNGLLPMMPDTAFDANRMRNRSVILYGNASTNSAWDSLLADAPVNVDRGVVTVGDRTIAGDDLACLFIQPRPGSDVASVGVVSGTGLEGMHTSNRLPYFVSGVAYPDLTVIRSTMLEQGADGIEAAGFFGNDWQVETGDFAFRE